MIASRFPAPKSDPAGITRATLAPGEAPSWEVTAIGWVMERDCGDITFTGFHSPEEFEKELGQRNAEASFAASTLTFSRDQQ